jgi:hypothetical protein
MEMLQSTPSLSLAAEPYVIRSIGKEICFVQTISRGMPKWQHLESILSVHVDRNLYSVDDTRMMQMRFSTPAKECNVPQNGSLSVEIHSILEPPYIPWAAEASSPQ